jgi:protease II
MTRNMTLAHRSEVMDAHILSRSAILSRLSGLGTSLCAHWKKICLTKAEHVEDFELMDENTSPDNQSSWKHVVEHADTACLHDISVMDIYNVKLPNSMPYFESQAMGFMLFSGSSASQAG